MAPEIQTSFIPKKNMASNVARVSSNATMGLFMLVGVVILSLSLLIFAGAYGYQYWLADSINRPCVAGNDQGCGLRASLERDKRELQVERIIRFSRLDAKMKTASGIINNHNTLIPLLDTLESLTIQTIRYTKMDFTPQGVTVEGLAVGYDDIAVQLKTFKDSDKVKSAVFSGLGLDNRGNITFKLALTFDNDLTSYVASRAPVEEAVVESPVESTTTTGSEDEDFNALVEQFFPTATSTNTNLNQ